MHFSWGGECKCAHCCSSVWAIFCSVNTYSLLWFECLFLERQTSLVNNHVSSWYFFFNKMSSYNCYLGLFFFVSLFLLNIYSLLPHYCIITGFSCIFYVTVNLFSADFSNTFKMVVSSLSSRWMMRLSTGPCHAIAVYASQHKAQYMKKSGGLHLQFFNNLLN